MLEFKCKGQRRALIPCRRLEAIICEHMSIQLRLQVSFFWRNHVLLHSFFRWSLVQQFSGVALSAPCDSAQAGHNFSAVAIMELYTSWVQRVFLNACVTIHAFLMKRGVDRLQKLIAHFMLFVGCNSIAVIAQQSARSAYILAFCGSVAPFVIVPTVYSVPRMPF